MNNSTIFIIIASYSDPECKKTINEIYNKALFPDRIFIGLCWQYDLLDNLIPYDEDCKYKSQIRSIFVEHKDAKGVTWARHKASQLYQDEDYIFFIDSHMLFEMGWDTFFIEELENCPSNKPILSAFPAPYRIKENKEYPPPMINSVVVSKLSFPTIEEYPSTVLLSTSSRVSNKQYYTPIRGAFYAAGCSFASAMLLKEIPIDPYMGWDEEEMVMSIKLWTYGWNIYAPRKHMIHHLYAKSKTIDSLDNHRKRTDKSILKKRFELSKKRFFHLLSYIKTDAKDSLIDIDLFPLGNKRSIVEFEKFAGIDLKRQQASIHGFETWFNVDNTCHPLNNIKKNQLYKFFYSNYIFNKAQGKVNSGERLNNTNKLKNNIQVILKKYQIKTIMDLGCGAHNWISKLNFDFVDKYRGVDFIDETIHEASRKYQDDKKSFNVGDIRELIFDSYDLVIVRDVFTHMSYRDIINVMTNIKKSNSKFILTSHYSEIRRNKKGLTTYNGEWNKLNFTVYPYYFIKPMQIIEDQSNVGKYMALWKIDSLPNFNKHPFYMKQSDNTLIIKNVLTLDESIYLEIFPFIVFPDINLQRKKILDISDKVYQDNCILQRILIKLNTFIPLKKETIFKLLVLDNDERVIIKNKNSMDVSFIVLGNQEVDDKIKINDEILKIRYATLMRKLFMTDLKISFKGSNSKKVIILMILNSYILDTKGQLCIKY